MQLNIQTLVLVDIYVLLLVGLLMLHAWWRGSREVTLGYLAAALLLGCLGSVLSSLRGMGIDWVAIVLGNQVLFLGAGLCWAALRLFGGRQVHWPGVAAGALLWALLCLLPVFYGSLSLRLLVYSLIIVVYSGLGAWELWRSRRQLEVDVHPALVLLLGHACFHVLRALLDRDMPYALTGHGSNFFSLLVLETMLFSTGIAFVTLTMVKERAEQVYKNAALRDPLTGIGNRRAFIAAAERLLADCARLQRPAVLLLCDLDHFKRLNDSFGHAVGDQALSDFGKILMRRSRQQDLCARIGGEEFVCLLAEADAQAAFHVAERIRREFAELPFVAEGQLSVSIGIAEAMHADYELNRLLPLADQALYAAKAAGRNRVEIYPG